MTQVCNRCTASVPMLKHGRCPECFRAVGLADAPPPPEVIADTNKVQCKRCTNLITAVTAWRTLGFCMQCICAEDVPFPPNIEQARERFSRILLPGADAPATSFFARYEAGERETVWQEIHELGAGVGQGSIWDDVCKTVHLTMQRVRANVETIVEDLRSINYQFDQPEQAHQPPTEQSLEQLALLEAEFGSLPLSLRMFYEIVGSVNLCQSKEQQIRGVFEAKARAKIPFIYILGEENPLYVASPATLMHMAPRASQNHEGRRWLWIAPDECARAHYSNGDDCHVLLPEAGADFRWVEMRDDNIDQGDWLWFVDMLRQSFKSGGFPGPTKYSQAGDGCEESGPRNYFTSLLAESLIAI